MVGSVCFMSADQTGFSEFAELIPTPPTNIINGWIVNAVRSHDDYWVGVGELYYPTWDINAA